MHQLNIALLIVTLVALKASATVLLNASRKDKPSANSDENLDEIILPVEAAYLTQQSGGYALFVLLFDLVHREVKAPGNLLIEDNRQTYAGNLATVVKKSITDYSKRKVEEALCLDIKTNPLGFLMRLPLLFRLIKAGLIDTFREIIKDPRNLRKYVSLSGLARLAAEIGATSYKQRLTDELRKNLLSRGLIYEETVRQKIAQKLALAAVIFEIAAALILFYTFGPWTSALAVYLTAVLGALFIKITIGARHYIPYYNEVMNILSHSGKANWRMKLLTSFLKVINFLLYSLAYFAFAMVFSIGSFILFATQIITGLDGYLMLLAQLLVQIAIFSQLWQAYTLYQNDCATPRGMKLVADIKAKHQGLSSFNALKSMLTDGSYNSEMSYMLAVYGPETLLFL
ncbi:MAG: hypothetical protein LCH63_00210 [Candidatus Melainabacteria bacterium]|nr:hypothetical protein [Candidatus Melainabacteria bacterium]